MVAPLQIGGGIQVGGGISVGTSSAPPTPTTQWDANPTTYIAQYTANGDGTGSITYYSLNCTDQTPDPAIGGALTYFQVWCRGGDPTTVQPQTIFTAYDATLGQSYTITPNSGVFSVDGGQTFTCTDNSSSAPSLTNITQITQY